MASSYLAAERRVAIEAVQAACSITTNVFQTLVFSESITKKDKSPVTIGDFSAQAAVNEVLSHHFPDDGIVGEEDSADLQGEQGADLRSKVSHLVNESLLQHGQTKMPLSDTQLLNAIDLGSFPGGKSKPQPKPKDGEIRSKQIAGLGALFVAVRGQGAVVRPIQGNDVTEKPIHMRDLQGDFTKSAFCESVEAGHSSLTTNARIAELLGIPKDHSVRMDSQAKYASIARGDGDIYLRLPVGDGSYQEKIWDHAAGSLLVEEAGGTVSDIAGRPLDFSQGRTLNKNRGVIACQTNMHGRLTEAVAQALQEEGRAQLLAPVP
ncbi:3'(2'),5'-bisphosphate nucleotidase [Malassezia brasiliensis]|uniref:3'(2'),5'-bisphosphate nucleotidase n=1 Tax=Malassezia brasiliensis TaxID=1821822 RepID=A0AAF0IPX9_9BASI|nr:3'(2'),5'-bisphosphate nucleotidase [Malassezia brasiliensis]